MICGGEDRIGGSQADFRQMTCVREAEVWHLDQESQVDDSVTESPIN